MRHLVTVVWAPVRKTNARRAFRAAKRRAAERSCIVPKSRALGGPRCPATPPKGQRACARKPIGADCLTTATGVGDPDRHSEPLVAITLRLPANDMTGRHHFLELRHEGVYRCRFIKKLHDQG